MLFLHCFRCPLTHARTHTHTHTPELAEEEREEEGEDGEDGDMAEDEEGILLYYYSNIQYIK